MYEQEINIGILNNRIFLDRDCWNCSDWEPEERKDCEYCRGITFVPTEVGAEILAFLYRHTKLGE